MRPIDIRDIAQRLGGALSLPPHCSPDAQIKGFATDSREAHPGDLFIAIRGAQVDGHAFVEQAMAQGAVAALVERPVNAPHIRVNSVVAALARMASTFRDEFAGPVVGITGSAGKSSCKEFAVAALAPLGRVLKTEGNRNTEYTAPLMWAELGSPSPRVTVAVVVEMGMRGPGQIALLASFSKPTIAVVTNVGVSHISELGSRDAIARAKAELIESLPQDGTVILWAEDDYAAEMKELALRAPVGTSRRVLTFGFSKQELPMRAPVGSSRRIVMAPDAQIISYRPVSWERAEIEIDFQGTRYQVGIPVVGRHQALNAAAGFLAAVAAGVAPAAAVAGLANAELPPMRMAVRRRGAVTYLLDMYNASPASVLAALETVHEVSPSHKSASTFVAVLGEMRELGGQAESAHREVGAAVVASGVDRLIVLAPTADAPARWIAEAALAAGMPASNVELASSHQEVKAILEGLEGDNVVLVKASRGVELERALPEGIR